jgi:hypothetical protein
VSNVVGDSQAEYPERLEPASFETAAYAVPTLLTTGQTLVLRIVMIVLRLMERMAAMSLVE